MSHVTSWSHIYVICPVPSQSRSRLPLRSDPRSTSLSIISPASLPHLHTVTHRYCPWAIQPLIQSSNEPVLEHVQFPITHLGPQHMGILDVLAFFWAPSHPP